MQLDCLTAESSPFKALGSLHCAKYDFLSALHELSSSSQHFIPLHVAVSPFGDPSCVLIPVCFFLLCALPLFLLPPPVLSSHGWCAGGGSYAL